MAEDPLQQIARDYDNAQSKKKNSILNELDDLDNNVIVSPPKQASHNHSITVHVTSANDNNRKKSYASGFTKKNKRNARGKANSVVYQNGYSNNMKSNNINNNKTFKKTFKKTFNKGFVHETHTLKKTMLSGLFEDEYEKPGKLHSESAMLHCGASYVLSEDNIVEGEIHLTNFLLYFLPKKVEDVPGGIKHLILPIASIARITEQQRSNNFTEIVLTNRIYRTVRFRLASDKQINYISSDKVLQMIRALIFPSRMAELFAFDYYKRHPAIDKLIQYQENKENKENKEKKEKKEKKQMSSSQKQIMLTSPRRDSSSSTDEKDEKKDDIKCDDDDDDDIWTWDIYDIEKEYNRMGVYMHDTTSTSTDIDLMSNSLSDIQNCQKETTQKTTEKLLQRHREYTSTRTPPPNILNMKGAYPRYRFTSVNKNYAICDSYPELFVVPSSITDWELTQVARFRRLGRIPILSWKSCDNNVALFRCSQPKVAMASNRSRADEHLIQSIAEANTSSIQNSVLYIMDARPKLNARVNKMRGGGFENTNFYKNAKLEFLNIDNIHIMRKSRKNLSNLIHNFHNLNLNKLKSSRDRDRDREWYNNLHSTEWMSHIRELLRGTYTMISVLTRENSSILCHCSDGWDRTSQLCCLVQLCLDSYFRTVKGFIILINKEWLSVGHQFEKRCGHRKDDAFEEDERSPIFEQFIECTYQLLQQYPLYFEFNQSFLICILDHLYSCKYGTFLCDKLKVRQEYKLSQRTLSLWTHLQNCKHSMQFKNIYYKPTKKQLIPKYSLKILKFWKAWHFRNCPQHIMKKKPMYLDNGMLQTQQLYIELKNENETLKKEIANMKKDKITTNIQNIQNTGIHYQEDEQFD